MKCPIDQTTLLMSERQGIEIDYCPQCRGIWLDRGEVEKLIERSAPVATPEEAPSHFDEARPAINERQRHYDYEDDDDDRHHGPHDGRMHRKHKREGFLGDLFDF